MWYGTYEILLFSTPTPYHTLIAYTQRDWLQWPPRQLDESTQDILWAGLDWSFHSKEKEKKKEKKRGKKWSHSDVRIHIYRHNQLLSFQFGLRRVRKIHNSQSDPVPQRIVVMSRRKIKRKDPVENFICVTLLVLTSLLTSLISVMNWLDEYFMDPMEMDTWFSNSIFQRDQFLLAFVWFCFYFYRAKLMPMTG